MENLSPIHAAILGIIQGITEFLPVSSSAHLVTIPWLLNWKEHGLDLDVGLHMGTLLAVLIHYRRTWLGIIQSIFEVFVPSLRKEGEGKEQERILLKYLCIATVPAAISGFFLESYVEGILRNPLPIASTLILFSFVLWYADARKRKTERSLKDLGIRDAIIIGLAQAFAVIPGFSRAATTISAALCLNFKREEAAHFSFLLSAPIIGGAVLLRLPNLIESKLYSTLNFWLSIGSAALLGYLAIRVLVGFVSKKNYLPFVIYRILLGALILLVYFSQNQ